MEEKLGTGGGKDPGDFGKGTLWFGKGWFGF